MEKNKKSSPELNYNKPNAMEIVFSSEGWKQGKRTVSKLTKLNGGIQNG